MNLHALLLEREAAGRPVTVGLIGAGKFGTMFLRRPVSPRACMSSRSPISTPSARGNSLPPPAGRPSSFRHRHQRRGEAAPHARHRRRRGDDRPPGIEVIVEATGIPEAGIVHAIEAIEHGKHIVMVNVEADAYGRPAGAEGEGRGRGLQPRLGRSAGLICEHVDWARACGFKVIAAAGHAPRAALPQVNPDNVWDILDSASTSPTANRSTRRCSTASSTAPSPASR